MSDPQARHVRPRTLPPAEDPDRAAPDLSVVVVAGPSRERGQRVVDAVGAQSVAGSIELVLVDVAAPGTPRFTMPAGLRTVYVDPDPTARWSSGRATGVLRASASVVAFLEDHCYPAPDWAANLIAAHRGPWAAVGYGFTNANPETYLARACMVNDYGPWHHPARDGATTLLPSSNVSYKRDVLLSFGERLETILTPDFNLQETLRKRGLAMRVEARALAAHENFETLATFGQAHFSFSRLLAARRVRCESWSGRRRLLFGLAAPVVSPAIGTARLFVGLRGRASLLPAFLSALPIYLVAHLLAALGEAQGYLFGEGSAEQVVSRAELEAPRSGSSRRRAARPLS